MSAIETIHYMMVRHTQARDYLKEGTAIRGREENIVKELIALKALMEAEKQAYAKAEKVKFAEKVKAELDYNAEYDGDTGEFITKKDMLEIINHLLAEQSGASDEKK